MSDSGTEQCDSCQSKNTSACDSIVGVSGAGKTSLMSILTGNLEPTSGTVEMRVGEDWVNMCEPGYYARGRAKPYIGLLYQEYDLYPHRTVIENLTDSIGLEFPAELAEKKAVRPGRRRRDLHHSIP